MSQGNEDSCVNAEDVDFKLDMVPTTITLTLINMVILAGNSLVIIAVITTRKLRTNTNTYIVSLACSDILLGIFVIPFSASLEVLTYWPFGEVWCRMWLTIDVLLCTASILNLCAISFDRYLAVTKPIQYASAMSRKRSKVLVAIVWLLSFVICIPPLLGWNDKTSYSEIENENVSNVTDYVTSNISDKIDIGSLACNMTPPQCELTSTQGYRIYSALGSFYIPMFLMVFFYCKIYKAAVKTSSAIRTGILTSKHNDDNMEKNNDPIILRIHRGNSVVSRSTRYPQRTASLRSNLRHNGDNRIRSRHCVFSECNSTGAISNGKDSDTLQPKRMYFEEPAHETEKENLEYIKLNNNTNKPEESPFMKRRRSTAFIYDVHKRSIDSRSLNSVPEGRHGRIHIRKILKETKATKTVAIIVGVFIMCWFPFFTMYLIEAFWGTRVPSLAFSVMFWLGYCNSMLNPFIYGMFSRDFRSAFRRILHRTCYKCSKLKCVRLKRPSELVVHKRALGFPVIDFESTSES